MTLISQEGLRLPIVLHGSRVVDHVRTSLISQEGLRLDNASSLGWTFRVVRMSLISQEGLRRCDLGHVHLASPSCPNVPDQAGGIATDRWGRWLGVCS